MDSCLNIEKFHNNLVEIVNNCNLTVGTALYVLKDVYNDLYEAYQISLKKELSGENLSIETQEMPFFELENDINSDNK